MRIPLTICRFHIQVRIPRELNCTKHIYYYLFMDSTKCSGLRKFCSEFNKFCCGFRNVACFWSDFEHDSVLATGPWKPKQQKRSKKISNVAESATIQFLACCDIRLQFTKCTVWPRDESRSLPEVKNHPKHKHFVTFVTKVETKSSKLIKKFAEKFLNTEN